MAAASVVIGERLADLGGWELYRFMPEDGDEAVCTVALLPSGEGVGYGVFRATDGEPSASGTIARDGGPWSDTAREAVLEEILAAYRPQLPALSASVRFDLAPRGED